MSGNKRLVVFSIMEAFRKELIWRMGNSPPDPTPDIQNGDSKKKIGAKNRVMVLDRRSYIWFESQDFISGSDAARGAVADKASKILASAQA